VLALGAMLVLWGGYAFVVGPRPEPVAEARAPRFCAPSVAEVLGMDSGGERLQGLVVAAIGGVAMWLAASVLRHRERVL
jgi:hypothetical protein